MATVLRHVDKRSYQNVLGNTLDPDLATYLPELSKYHCGNCVNQIHKAPLITFAGTTAFYSLAGIHL